MEQSSGIQVEGTEVTEVLGGLGVTERNETVIVMKVHTGGLHLTQKGESES